MTPAAPTLVPALAPAHPDHAIDEEFFRIVDELTRRGFLAGGLAAAAALGLAACAPDTSPATTPATRRITTASGAVEVPADPRRVVTINAYAYKTMLDLGLTPVMGIAGPVAAGFQISAYLDRMRKVPSPVNDDGSDKLEQIARTKPDLIFSFGADKSLPQLRALAPTIAADPTQSWQQLAKQTADALGRDAAFEKLRRDNGQRVAAFARKHSAELTGNKWYVLAPGDDQDWSLWLPDVGAGVILAELGATFGSLAAGHTGQYQPYSLELLNGLGDGDVLLVADGGDTPSAQAATLFATPGWRDLPAVKAGQVYRTNLCSVASYGESNALLDVLQNICTHLSGDHR